MVEQTARLLGALDAVMGRGRFGAGRRVWRDWRDWHRRRGRVRLSVQCAEQEGEMVAAGDYKGETGAMMAPAEGQGARCSIIHQARRVKREDAGE